MRNIIEGEGFELNSKPETEGEKTVSHPYESCGGSVLDSHVLDYLRCAGSLRGPINFIKNPCVEAVAKRAGSDIFSLQDLCIEYGASGNYLGGNIKVAPKITLDAFKAGLEVIFEGENGAKRYLSSDVAPDIIEEDGTAYVQLKDPRIANLWSMSGVRLIDTTDANQLCIAKDPQLLLLGIPVQYRKLFSLTFEIIKNDSTNPISFWQAKEFDISNCEIDYALTQGDMTTLSRDNFFNEEYLLKAAMQSGIDKGLSPYLEQFNLLKVRIIEILSKAPER